MLRLLELRLDNVVYRSGFARTRMQARQFTGHGHFTLNGIKVTIPSIIVKVGDVIELRPKLMESALYKSLLEELEEYAKESKGKISSTRWIDVDVKKLKITVNALPEKDDFEEIIDIQKIIEFYSK